jgi:hypothetical protein
MFYVVEGWVEQKATPNFQHKSHEKFCIKYSRSDFNGFLRLKSWEFAFILGLANMKTTLVLHPQCVNKQCVE